jgi:transcriptional regulator GlxA family with amidase domain
MRNFIYSINPYNFCIMKIAIFIFDNYTALDVIGPYEVVSKLPGAQVCFVGTEKKLYADSHGLRISAGYTLDEVEDADILLIPGGFGVDPILKDQDVISWIQKVDHTSKWTVSVCAGSLLLAEAGLLKGKKCTSHWGRKKQLMAYDVEVAEGYERYVRDGKVITSAGVSAGIDMALYLVSLIAGDTTAQVIELAMEYDPKPPFHCGTPDKAPREILEKMKRS